MYIIEFDWICFISLTCIHCEKQHLRPCLIKDTFKYTHTHTHTQHTHTHTHHTHTHTTHTHTHTHTHPHTPTPHTTPHTHTHTHTPLRQRLCDTWLTGELCLSLYSIERACCVISLTSAICLYGDEEKWSRLELLRNTSIYNHWRHLHCLQPTNTTKTRT